METFKYVFSVIALFLGAVTIILIDAPTGLGLVGISVALAVMANMDQAAKQHRELLAALTETTREEAAEQLTLEELARQRGISEE